MIGSATIYKSSNGAPGRAIPRDTSRVRPNPTTTPGYYEWVRFQIYASAPDSVEYMIGDGGFNNWTQKLLSDRRERLLTSGIATERIATLFRQNANR